MVAAKRKHAGASSRAEKPRKADDRAAGVEASVLGPAGRSDEAVRRAVLERAAQLAGRDAPSPERDVPETLAPLVEKIVRYAYRVTDEDIAVARAAGHREDELFDVIVAAALGAGLARREQGLAAIAAWEHAR